MSSGIKTPLLKVGTHRICRPFLQPISSRIPDMVIEKTGFPAGFCKQKQETCLTENRQCVYCYTGTVPQRTKYNLVKSVKLYFSPFFQLQFKKIGGCPAFKLAGCPAEISVTYPVPWLQDGPYRLSTSSVISQTNLLCHLTRLYCTRLFIN